MTNPSSKATVRRFADLMNIDIAFRDDEIAILQSLYDETTDPETKGSIIMVTMALGIRIDIQVFAEQRFYD